MSEAPEPLRVNRVPLDSMEAPAEEENPLLPVENFVDLV
jgi:hypothetical protein